MGAEEAIRAYEDGRTADWTEMYNELYGLYCSPNISLAIEERDREEDVAHMVEQKNTYRVLVETPEGK